MTMEITARPLPELEAVIERGLATFVEVGQALLEIRQGRLYRDSHDSFENYCRDRWGFNRQRASQLIQAAEVSKILDTPPSNDSQARELSRLKDDPEAAREVWSEVTSSGQPVTAAAVHDAVDRKLGVPTPVRPAPRSESEDDVETGGLCFECRQPIPLDADECPSCSPAPMRRVEPAQPVTVADLVADGFVVPPKGLDPHRKAWYAALSPSHFTRLDPGDVVATAEPRELERGLQSIDESIAYLERLRAAGRAALGRTRLEVVQ